MRDSQQHEMGRGADTSEGIIWLFGQMLMIPFTVMVYGIQMFANTMQGLQRTTSDGLGVMARGSPQPQTGAPLLEVQQPPPAQPAQPQQTAQSAAPSALAPAASGQGSSVMTSPPPPQAQNSIARSSDVNPKERRVMDQDLHDDMLKLVRYKVLFVKREYETAFREQEDLVSDNMDASAFTAWKIAQFIQDLNHTEGDQRVRIPSKWGDRYPSDRDRYVRDGYLIGFPPEDKKYLRVYYEVLDRYPREKFKYEEEQIEVLRDIRDEIRSRPGTSGTPGTRATRTTAPPTTPTTGAGGPEGGEPRGV